jgi:hypothetical protein
MLVERLSVILDRQHFWRAIDEGGLNGVRKEAGDGPASASKLEQGMQWLRHGLQQPERESGLLFVVFQRRE